MQRWAVAGMKPFRHMVRHIWHDGFLMKCLQLCTHILVPQAFSHMPSRLLSCTSWPPYPCQARAEEWMISCGTCTAAWRRNTSTMSSSEMRQCLRRCLGAARWSGCLPVCKPRLILPTFAFFSLIRESPADRHLTLHWNSPGVNFT